MFISTKFTPQIAGDTENPVADMLAGSLERFATDYIDIYWIHNPAGVEKWTPYLIPLVKSGKVKRIGVSNHNLAQIKRAEEILSAKEDLPSLPCRTITACSTVHRRKPVFWTIARTLNIDFWAYMVLEQGALSGKYDTTHPLPVGSQRGDTYNPLLPQIEKLVAVMRTVSVKYGITPAQVALAWAIAKGTTPIISVTKPSQVQDALQATKFS